MQPSLFSRLSRRTVVRSMGVILTTSVSVPSARADDTWEGVVAAGAEFNVSPEFVGHGWVFFDARGKSLVGNGDLVLVYNTTKLHVAIDRLSFAGGKLAFFAFAEAEALLSQLLTDYFKRGRRIFEFGFNASYVLLSTKLQWYPGKHQTLEVLAQARYWWFANSSRTAASVVLPPDTFVFEPRVGYVFWKVDAPAGEWDAHRLFPRIRGVGLGVTGGVDVRARTAAWGTGDGRNDANRAIYTVRQWLHAGWQFVPLARLQLDQWGSYGWNEDDITRNRIGGVNPYVIPVPGLPWSGLISERLFSALLGFHLRTSPTSPHEFGILVGGGAFNDVTRDDRLDTYGGAAGVSLFGDLRFGPDERWQLHARLSYGFPVVWLLEGPYVAMLLAVGARAF